MASKLLSPTGLYATSAEDDEELEAIPEDVRKQTQIVLFDYVDYKSQEDKELSARETSLLHDSASACIREIGETAGQGVIAENVASLLRDYGDRFQSELDQDERLQEMSRQAVTDTDSGQPNPMTMAAHVRTVVEQVFGIDRNGVAQNINFGRIVSVFYYIYSLCKKFVNDAFANHTMMQFLLALSGYLVATFVRVRFFQWLDSQGGWGQMIVNMFPSMFPPWSNNMLLAGGVFLIGLWAYRLYKGLN